MYCRPVRVEAAGYNPFYNPRYKSTLCAHWQQGNCHKGNKCSFAHGTSNTFHEMCELST